MGRWVIPVAVAVGAWLAFVGLIWLVQRRLIYFPGGSVPEAQRASRSASEAIIDVEGGLRLGGWVVRPDGETTGAGVLVFNGNAGNRADRLPIAEAFSRAGYTVLLFDYRGYGGNPGRPTEQGLIADGIAARRHLASIPDVDPSRIVYYGESLGAAVAVAVAAEIPPQALILRSPFTSMVEIGKQHYPYLPVTWILKDRFRSLRRIPHFDGPLLVVAGTRDATVPESNSRDLFQAATSKDKTFISIPGADHNDQELIGDEVMRQTFAFLTQRINISP